MRTAVVASLLPVMMLLLPSRLNAQYWGENVLEKGFEQTGFFFVPSTLNPFGIGSFSSTTPGLLNEPLLNLAVSPAHLSMDSTVSHYVYADFRSARTIQDQGNGFTPPWIAYRTTEVAVHPYPWVYLNTRRVLEPVFSGAYITRPVPDAQPGLVLGASYQLILQDDKYYSVPQDIYRSVIGQDYEGNRAAGASSMPIVDRYSGEDNMHQRGHFLAAFGSYEIPSLGSVGLKVGRVLFDRSGGFGSSNFWGTPSQSTSTSLWSNLESRSETYNHWEVTGGADLRLNGTTTVGASAGWLWGDATQALTRGDSSFYDWSSNPDRSFYMSSGSTLEEWRHNGRTQLLGVDVTTHPTERHTVRLLYQRQRATVDIGLGTGIFDTSYSFYSFTYLDTPRTSTSYSALMDQRSGLGQQIATTNRLMASLQWQIDARVDLALGLQFDWLKTETNTTESVLARMQTVYQTGWGVYDWRSSSDQSKDLQWTFTSTRTSFQIPIVLTIKTSETINVLLGLNRAMTYSKADDVTLALFRYRRSNQNGTITDEQNFGERYTAPPEELSDVRTTFLAGIIARPSGPVCLRLLVVPNFQDTFEGSELQNLQWWISVNLAP